MEGPLSALDEDDRAELVRRGTWRTFDSGEALTRQGGTSRSLYLVVEGRARVVMTTADGQELLVAILGPGDTVGELSLLDGEPRSASVWAVGRVEALAVAGSEFGDFLLARPRVTVGMLRILSRRLRESDALRLQMAVASSEQRLAWSLMRLAADHGEVTEDGAVHLAVALSQEDLASFVGVSREAVNQALGRLREDGLVATARRSTTILDLDALRQRARP